MLICLTLLRKTFFYLFKRSMGVWPVIGKIHTRETVCRFLFEGDFRNDQSVKPKAFLPPPDSGELSVYRISNLSSFEVMSIGKYFVETVSRRRKPEVLGEATMKVSSLKSIRRNLVVKAWRCPHPRHANIINLPVVPKNQTVVADYKEIKQEQKNVAQAMVSLVSGVTIYS